MKYFYSPSTTGFYIDAINGIEEIPSDAFEISEEKYNSLFAEQEQGRVITMVNGELTTVEFTHPPATWDDIRAKRSRLLSNSDWTQVNDVALTSEQVSAWKSYRQALRDLTDTYATPGDVVWPIVPDA